MTLAWSTHRACSRDYNKRKLQSSPLCFHTYRDGENAYVSVNDKLCWSKTLVGTIGTQECGGIFLEEAFRITGCYVTLSGSGATLPLTVRVWADLDQGPTDESFGIDNVLVQQGMTKRILVYRTGMKPPLAHIYTCIHVSTYTHTHVHTRMHIFHSYHVSHSSRECHERNSTGRR